MNKPKNIRELFDIIIENLEKKAYWNHISLWQECLLKIADESVRNEIEIRFAKKVLDILQRAPYKKKSEKLILSLYSYYPISKHAPQFKQEAWELFKNAKHPVVQTLGISILNDIGRNDPVESRKLIQALKNRFNDFEKNDDDNPDQSFDFLYRNNNSIPLIIANRKNLQDFVFILSKLKSKHPFLKYLVMQYFDKLIDMMYSLRTVKFPELMVILEYLDTQKFLSLIGFSAFIDRGAAGNIENLKDFSKLHDEIDIRGFFASTYIDRLRENMSEYTAKWQHLLTVNGNREKIENWVDTAADKLYTLPDEQLQYFFPGTSREELDIFRKKAPIMMDMPYPHCFNEFSVYG